jgi:opacity protein-like surface antigen
MRFAVSSLAALGALVLAASTAFAQFEGESHTRPRMFHIGIGGGVSVPTSDAKDFLENGWNGQAWVSFTPPVFPISLRAAFDLQKNDFKTNVAGPGIPTLGSGASSQVMAGLANARIDLLHGAFVPYLTVGLGGYSVKTDSDSTGVESQSETHFGINGGAGLAIVIKQITFYVEGRVDNVYTDKGVIDTKSINLVPVTVGIAY